MGDFFNIGACIKYIKSIRVQKGGPSIFQVQIQYIIKLIKSNMIVPVFFKSKFNDFFKLYCKKYQL